MTPLITQKDKEQDVYLKVKELLKTAPAGLKKVLFSNWHAPQRADKHPEGNTLKHILVVLKRAVHKYWNEPEGMDMVFAALFHDLGKKETLEFNPKTGEPTAYGHEEASLKYIDEYSGWIWDNGGRPNIVKDIVQNHMRVKNLDSMITPKQTAFYGKRYFDKIKQFRELDKGGHFIAENRSLQGRESLTNIIIERVVARLQKK